VDCPVRITKDAPNRRAIVEVDHYRGGAAGRDDVGLIIVADERRYVMPMLVQIHKYVRADEPCCTGQCHLHG
jgi:hypothetical protein